TDQDKTYAGSIEHRDDLKRRDRARHVVPRQEARSLQAVCMNVLDHHQLLVGHHLPHSATIKVTTLLSFLPSDGLNSSIRPRRGLHRSAMAHSRCSAPG